MKISKKPPGPEEFGKRGEKGCPEEVRNETGIRVLHQGKWRRG